MSGNLPPDFVVGDDVAVEVRRLNQNHETGEAYGGLEVPFPTTLPAGPREKEANLSFIWALRPAYQSTFSSSS